MLFKLLVIVSVLCFTTETYSQLISIRKDNSAIRVEEADDGLSLVLVDQNGEEKLSGYIGLNTDLTTASACAGLENCVQFGDSRLRITSNVENGYNVLWSTTNVNAVFKDCFVLNSSTTHWYGGPESYVQYWPIEQLTLNNFANVPQEKDYGAIVEPYWLNSKGGYLFVDEKVPLFIDQNSEKDDTVCFIAKIEYPYPNRPRVLLNYTIVAEKNARTAHLHAVNHFLGKPSGHPAFKMIERPVWSTWARYKTHINESVLIEFANDIVSNGFADGQFEIDDYWETCYGSLTFRDPEFTNITETVQTIKDMGFRVSLWIHPFVNIDCDYTEIGRKNGFFVKNQDGSLLTQWWNSKTGEAQYIDFTNVEAKEWFVSRLRQLETDHGIDALKFDAGETSWAPQIAKLYGDVEDSPQILTSEYVRACATFGDAVEVRTGWRTQDLPVFVRMIDKDSRWGANNGLYTLITTMLQMNLNGYTMVLPDMVGGNGYSDGAPSAELFIRWLQANTFMPSIQFSFVPWDYSEQEVSISQKFVALHALYAEEIVRAMEKSVSYGHPVNPPVWWVDPTNSKALEEDTEFLVGEDILVAPIVEEGATTRNVFLPSGTWIDGNTDEVYEGNRILENYNAPINILPYFLRQGSSAAKIHVRSKVA